MAIGLINQWEILIENYSGVGYFEVAPKKKPVKDEEEDKPLDDDKDKFDFDDDDMEDDSDSDSDDGGVDFDEGEW